MTSKSATITEGDRLAPVHPGEVLREEFLTPMGLSAAALARRIGVPGNRVSEIAAGRRAVTGDTRAAAGGGVRGPAPEFWMNLQSRWELDGGGCRGGRGLGADAGGVRLSPASRALVHFAWAGNAQWRRERGGARPSRAGAALCGGASGPPGSWGSEPSRKRSSGPFQARTGEARAWGGRAGERRCDAPSRGDGFAADANSALSVAASSERLARRRESGCEMAGEFQPGDQVQLRSGIG